MSKKLTTGNLHESAKRMLRLAVVALLLFNSTQPVSAQIASASDAPTKTGGPVGSAIAGTPTTNMLDIVGLQLRDDSKFKQVASVRPNSEAARAGIQVGDKVIAAMVANGIIEVSLKRDGTRLIKNLSMTAGRYVPVGVAPKVTWEPTQPNPPSASNQLDTPGGVTGYSMNLPTMSSPNGSALPSNTSSSTSSVSAESGAPHPYELRAQTYGSGADNNRLSRPEQGRLAASTGTNTAFPLSATTNVGSAALVDPQAFKPGVGQMDNSQRPPYDLRAQRNGIPMMNTPTSTLPLMNAPMPVRILSDYNIELIVDRSMSMRRRDCPGGLSRWEWCGSQAQDLANALAPYVPTGLTIVPFCAEYQVFPFSSVQSVANLFHNVPLCWGTKLYEPLKARLESYFAARQPNTKPLLIAVITDGIPFPPPQPDMVRDELIRASAGLRDANDVTVVFFQIGGQDRFGHDYLQSLDTDLVKQGSRYHYVHMIPFERLMQVGLAQALADTVRKHENSPPRSGWKLF